MIICKDCRCFHPVTVSDRYCGECCIGDTKNPISINADITGCCLFEPKQPKKPKPLTNADRIRQMTDEELAEWLTDGHEQCDFCAQHLCDFDSDCVHGVLKWLQKEVSRNDKSSGDTDGKKVLELIDAAPTIESEPVRHGRWIECDYKHMEHGMIETEPKAGLCCSECRTGFKKNHMTYKAFCPACGARMDYRTPTEVQLDEADSVMMGGSENA